MIFKLAADGSETALYNFTGGADGGAPGGVIADAQGNLYGGTTFGGDQDCTGPCGVIFKVTPDGQETVLYAFPGSLTMGFGPTGQLTLDSEGNLYGATVLGGGGPCNSGLGCGVVFKLAPNGNFTVLHAFTGGDDGQYPNGTLILDAAGNLYGTTQDGAPATADACQTVADVDCGTVFRIAQDGTYTLLHAFGGLAGGLNPTEGLVVDAEGNLYGTTGSGGINPGNICPSDPPYWFARGGCGVVFKLAPDGGFSVLYAFQGGKDGAYPVGSLYLNPNSGGLYGTAESFFGNGSYCSKYRNCGLVFSVMPDGTKRTVYNFASSIGLAPNHSTPLVKGHGAQLVGIAAQGKTFNATVYSLDFGNKQ